MRQVMAAAGSKVETIRRTYRSFHTDASYLQTAVEVEVSRKVREAILKEMSDGQQLVSAAHVAKALHALHSSVFLCFAGPKLQGEVLGVINLVEQIGMGVPLKEQDISKYITFYKQVLLRAEHFCALKVKPALEAAWGPGR